MKYYLATFGCQLNKSDSERIASKLEEMGYESALNINEADLVVINMCSVRQSAVDRIYGRAKALRRLRRKGAKTLLTGCVLPKDKRQLKKEFDYILHIKTLSFWQDALEKERFYYYPSSRDPMFCARYGWDYFHIKPKFKNKFSVYVPIAAGCNNFCSYCVVPYARGPFMCRSVMEIVDEAGMAVRNGAKEIWLVASNVNSYQYGPTDFSELLGKVNNIPGSFWINFTSSHPKDFSKKLIQAIKNCGKAAHYVSLPVQSGSNGILKTMNRPYNIEEYKKTIERIKAAIPDAFLSTDIIVGFPGETEKDFQATKELFQEIGFNMAYIAEYSQRPHTAAAKMKNNVPKKEKEKRRKELTEILKKYALEKNKGFIGKTAEVLIFQKKGSAFMGKTRNYRTVKISRAKNSKEKIGKIVKVKVTDAIPWGLKGELAP